MTSSPLNMRMQPSSLDALITGRPMSLLSPDINANAEMLRELIQGRRILVVGGGGSIGSATTSLLVDYQPSVLHVVDQSENYLAELVRQLRGSRLGVDASIDFRTFPLDYGSPIMERLLSETAPYDFVLNFAALKHVRSEKDVFSLLQMIDTNIVRHARFKRWLNQNGHGARYFAVSTDKAANPTSLMGASKRLMEDMIFAVGVGDGVTTTSARFANVAFSNGSLLQSFHNRIAMRQPIAVPRDTKRYFVSQSEAGEICLLATFFAPNQHIVFPRMDPEQELQTLESTAVRFLAHLKYTPTYYEDEDSARAAVERDASQGKWPLLMTALDTSGEKPYEEFCGDGETAVEIGLSSLRALRHQPSPALDQGLFERLESMVLDARPDASKEGIVEALSSVLTNFRHIETGRNLDQRL